MSKEIKLTKRQKEFMAFMRRGWNLVHSVEPYRNVTLFKKRQIEMDGSVFVELKNKGLLEHSHCNWGGVHYKISSQGKTIKLLVSQYTYIHFLIR